VVVAGAPGWLLWLEDEGRTEWTAAEAGALTLAGQALARWLAPAGAPARWVAQLHSAAQQERLEAVARVARRLAHDYGNVFTGILGFTELGLAHPSPGGALVQSYLHEVHRSAQNGARLTHQLRLFSRRQFHNPSPGALAAALEESCARLAGPPDQAGRLYTDLPADLPPLAMDTEHTRHVLDALLDNDLEAAGQGTVTVSARAVPVGPEECVDYLGDVHPGPHVAIEVHDTGPGLSAEARQRVLVEPFYTGKARHRGMGLAIAYGVLAAHHGGLRLLPGPDGGVLARALVPVAVPAAPPAAAATTATAGPGGEKVLVVDDDPLILNLIRATLEGAGYRVQAVTSAEEALTSYSAAQPEPFRLVLSDVLMPRVTGVDLARLLLKHDANVKLLFMSGQGPHEAAGQDLFGERFGLLPKPFRPESLLRAVRSALDRPAPWKSSGRPGAGGEPCLKPSAG
jgi:signal transduction histidine kinase/ActR/RegA family two-component response regulator